MKPFKSAPLATILLASSAVTVTPDGAIDETTPAVDETAATPEVETPAAKSKPVQFTCGITEDDKAEIALLCESFIGPALSKKDGKKMTEKEAINMLLNVANTFRYSFKEKMAEVDGEQVPVYDADGIQECEQVDNFEIEAKRVFALRDTKPEKIDMNSPEALKAQLVKLQARLDKLAADKIAAAATMENLGWVTQA